MRYGVKDYMNNVIGESTKTDSFETACGTALSLSNWNIECDVVDLENLDMDGKPIVLRHVPPYKDLFINSGRNKNEQNPIRELGSRSGVPFSPDH